MKILILALIASAQLLAQPAVTTELLTASASDFQAHQPPRPSDIRNVHPGYIPNGDGKNLLICGEFLSAENHEWKPFATIKTSGYEQWQGGQAASLCSQPQTVLDTATDLSADLKDRLGLK